MNITWPCQLVAYCFVNKNKNVPVGANFLFVVTFEIAFRFRYETFGPNCGMLSMGTLITSC